MRKKRNDKRIIAIIIAIILLAAYLIHLTPLISIYSINFITRLILTNWFNLILIMSACLVIDYAEGKMYEKNIEDLERKDD